MRRFVLAVTFVAITFTFAFSETFQAKISKVDGDKVTYQKGTFNKTDKKVEYGDAVTATIAKDAKVTKGKKGAETAVEKGFKDEMFSAIDKDKGVKGTITIADDGADKGKITEFRLQGGKKGA